MFWLACDKFLHGCGCWGGEPERSSLCSIWAAARSVIHSQGLLFLCHKRGKVINSPAPFALVSHQVGHLHWEKMGCPVLCTRDCLGRNCVLPQHNPCFSDSQCEVVPSATIWPFPMERGRGLAVSETETTISDCLIERNLHGKLGMMTDSFRLQLPLYI